MTASIKTTAMFLQPFQLPSFNETLPPGEYLIETDLLEPADWANPGAWTSSVLVRLHPRATHPGLDRTLKVPLSDLEHAAARDKLTGKALADYFLEEMLSDPMIRLVMQADGVAECELRALYSMRPEGWREDPRDRHLAGGALDGQGAASARARSEGERPGIGE
jgi:hypothetical protein